MKYKLKLKYPSLPKDWEDGMEIGQGDRGSLGLYSPCNGKYTDYYIPVYDVKNFPEFWEEIKEYGFEILQFRNKITGTIFNRCIDIPIFISNYENCEIYSIKRKFDREIFTIGDYCSPKNYKNPGRIEKFEFILEDQLRIQGKNERGRSWYLSLETVEKLKEPLFITEDGKDIYEGDEYYYIVEYDRGVIPNAWEVLITKADKNYEFLSPLGKNQFSSKEAAEEYINKPLYSRKQVINILKGFDRDINCFDERFDYNLYIERYKDEK